MRLMSDLRELQRDGAEGISASPTNDANLFQWTASIVGPHESPWEGKLVALNLTSVTRIRPLVWLFSAHDAASHTLGTMY